MVIQVEALCQQQQYWYTLISLKSHTLKLEIMTTQCITVGGQRLTMGLKKKKIKKVKLSG